MGLLKDRMGKSPEKIHISIYHPTKKIYRDRDRWYFFVLRTWYFVLNFFECFR